MWYVYIIRCIDDSYYVGLTDNVLRRFSEHKIGRGARYTKLHQPVVIEYKEIFSDYESAAKRESQIKRWSREKKSALIRGDVESLKKLGLSKTKVKND